MPENTLPAGERTVVVNQSRYGTLTIISLCFNALIFLVLLLAIAGHSHDQKNSQGDSDRDRGGDRHEGMRFHHHEFGREGRGGDFGHSGFGRDEAQGWNRGGSEGESERGRGWGGSGEGQNWNRGPGGDRAGGGFSGGPGGPGFGGSAGMNHTPTAAGMTDMIMAHLSRQLALTDQENTQIRPVVEQQVAQMQKDMEAQKQARAKALDDATAKIRPLLNADQQKQLDQIKTAMEQKIEPSGGSTPADKPKSE